ncbi:structure-specific endonuclease subunit SLX4 isoform X2 [Drosophila eugracilis]|uniref:structure-specific endonuclease subunit SLX4 isoform X2 n=1 Tax=Drosophila eugracilis TaxID=29029 RepID=UPI0007E623A9|nr:structure-specific endonuclease subunit SLX4 isoform X2 [Drosophila eugracilis]
MKTVTNATQGKISFEDKPIDDFIDLTQDFENSIFSEQSPKITSPVKPSASDSNVDILFGDVDINFSSEKSSFHLDIITTPNDTKRSSSFNDINFSENSIRRSNSVSTDYSFKSPLNFKMNLSADKLLLPVASPYAHSEASIDLTQNSNDESDVILLSDEEINYSIWKSNKTAKALDIENESSDSSFSSPVTKKRAVPQFRTESDLDDFLKAFSNDGNRSKSSNSPNKCSLSKDRAEFGILDAEPSQPLSSFELQSPIENSDINWAEASFLDPPIKPLARRSSHKFNDLLAKISKPESNSDLDYDEFDQMVFQNTKSASVSAETNDLPSGLDLLLRGEIKTTALPEPCAPKDQPQIVPDQVEIDGKVYSVGVCHTPKPDFATLSESEILKQLYEYGIKPLKRKQAVKLLEFIYNQTHPIMQAAHIRDLPPRSELIARSKSTPVMMEKPLSKLLKFTTEDSLTPTESKTEFKFNDASGEELLRFSQTIPPMLCNDFETFVMQTNVSKKTPQPLVPLHIAWHNLLCANPQLHESVLMFEPIDLQEVYLYLKHLGHRYDPKDLKSFFDQRCIIFRYELAAPGKQSERHVRKQPKKTSKRN